MGTRSDNATHTMGARTFDTYSDHQVAGRDDTSDERSCWYSQAQWSDRRDPNERHGRKSNCRGSETGADGIGRDTSDVTHRDIQRQRELFEADVEVLTAKRRLRGWSHESIEATIVSHPEFSHMDAERIYQTLVAEGAWIVFVRFPNYLSVHNELRLKRRIANMWPEVVLREGSTPVDDFEANAFEGSARGPDKDEASINMLFESNINAIEKELLSLEDAERDLHGRIEMYLSTDVRYSLSQQEP